MKVMNNDVTQTQEQTFYFRWTPEKKVDEKWILAGEILGVKIDIDIDGNPIKYDSTVADNAANPLREFFKTLVGSKLQLTLDAKTLEVVRIEGRKEIVNEMGTANKQMTPLLDKLLGEDALKEMAKTCFASQLMGPAKPGDSWSKRRQLNMGPIGTYPMTFRYTYTGKEGQLAKIKIESTLKTHPPAKQDGVGGLPFRIEKAALGGREVGVLFFDRARGRLARAESNQKLSGKLTVLIGGQETMVELTQTQQTMVRTTDVNPLDAGLQGSEAKELQRLREENERLRRRLQTVDEALRREDKAK
jgi:hypothetical protein